MPRGGGLMASGARLRLLLALWMLAAPARPVAADAGDGGWQRRGPGAAAAAAEEERCAVERRADLSYSEFVQHYAFSRPVILQRLTDNSWTCPSRSMWSTCYTPRILPPWATTLCISLGTIISANGHHFSSTIPHPHSACWVPQLLTALELQRWFLYPPEKTPEFHPNKTTLAWLQDVYPALAPSERPLECTVQAGEVLYFPDRWWHATLNLDTSVFISTFLS
ncbi:jmjC domain-containing protein 8 isoform X3 [Panthera tigris]|uniref:jmjC domain-containing protein 8 isoform X3 n=1 Tax=Panthera tigris TaxID=9694 RepID=UPI001C6F631C|nr:jmjC domain-containing protein 8 isoform X3 [Panthera tigris]